MQVAHRSWESKRLIRDVTAGLQHQQTHTHTHTDNRSIQILHIDIKKHSHM